MLGSRCNVLINQPQIRRLNDNLNNISKKIRKRKIECKLTYFKIEKDKRKKRAYKLIYYGILFEITNTINLNDEVLKENLIRLNNLNEKLKYFEIGKKLNLNLKEYDKKIFETQNIWKQSKRNHKLITRGAIIEEVEKNNKNYFDENAILGVLSKLNEVQKFDKQ